MLAQAIVSVIVLFWLVGAPTSASALSVRISSPAGGAEVAPTCTGAGPNPVSTRTMTLSCNPITVNGITVGPQSGATWRVVAQTSGNIQKVTIVNTKVSVPAGAAGLPKTLRIRAFSGNTVVGGQNVADFLAVAPGGRSAGVVLSANVTGNVVGTKISLTGRLATNTTKVINRSASPDNAVSLPLNCVGNTGCTFTATAGTKATYGDLAEVIQVTCPTGQATCVPVLTATVDVTLQAVTAATGVAVNLPNGGGFAAEALETPGAQGNTQTFQQNVTPSFSEFKAALQIVGLSKFASEFLVTRSGTAEINPPAQTIQLGWTSTSDGSSFTTTIPPGSFKQVLKKPRPVWAFNDEDEAGVRLAALITQLDSAGKKFAVAIGGQGADLADTDDQVTVQLAIGDQSGQAEIKPFFFPR
jgi:hypothetical protein